MVSPPCHLPNPLTFAPEWLLLKNLKCTEVNLLQIMDIGVTGATPFPKQGTRKNECEYELNEACMNTSCVLTITTKLFMYIFIHSVGLHPQLMSQPKDCQVLAPFNSL